MEITRIRCVCGRIRAILLFALSFILLFVFITSCAKKDIRNMNSSGTSIVCFGDSITFGYGVRPGEDYPSGLARMVKMPVINAGLDGDTTYRALRRMDIDVLDKDPVLVVIEFGLNDFLLGLPLEETIKNVEKMIRKIQDSGAMVAIADPGTKMTMSAYSLEFERLSKKYATILIPHLLEGIITAPSYKRGFIYPNARGYEIITQRIYRAIRPYLNRISRNSKHIRSR